MNFFDLFVLLNILFIIFGGLFVVDFIVVLLKLIKYRVILFGLLLILEGLVGVKIKLLNIFLVKILFCCFCK